MRVICIIFALACGVWVSCARFVRPVECICKCLYLIPVEYYTQHRSTSPNHCTVARNPDEIFVREGSEIEDTRTHGVRVLINAARQCERVPYTSRCARLHQTTNDATITSFHHNGTHGTLWINSHAGMHRTHSDTAHRLSPLCVSSHSQSASHRSFTHTDKSIRLPRTWSEFLRFPCVKRLSRAAHAESLRPFIAIVCVCHRAEHAIIRIRPFDDNAMRIQYAHSACSTHSSVGRMVKCLWKIVKFPRRRCRERGITNIRWMLRQEIQTCNL